MSKALLLLSSVLSFVFSNALEAQTVQHLLKRADALELHKTDYWYSLLHYDRSIMGWQSVVDDKKFFLAENGKTDARAELEASLKAFCEGDVLIEQHAIHRFPARLAWLLEKMPEAKKLFVADHSTEFEKIWKAMKPRQMKLIFPTQYMNNPSSLFGHTLLNVEGERNNKLLAYSINYAAVTEETNGMVFAYKGLLGMYPGYFSMGPYFEKVIEYSDLNMRDVWEYDLNLTEPEMRRLMMHIKEMSGIYYDYYFFDENCSYNLLFSLDVARPGLNLVKQAGGFWVLPVDTLKLVSKSEMIEDANYRASKATKVRHIADGLSNQERDLAKKMAMGLPSKEAFKQLDKSPKEHQIKILDLAAELMFINLSEGHLPQAVYKNIYLKTLAKRASLGRQEKPYEYPRPIDPMLSHDSFRVGLGAGSYDGEFYSSYSFRPAYHGLEDIWDGYARGSSIEMLKTELNYFHDEDKLRLRKLDVVTIHSYTPKDDFFKPNAWMVSLGAESLRSSNDEDLHLTTYLDIGFGGATNVLNDFLLYGIVKPTFYLSGALESNHMITMGGEVGTIYYINSGISAQLSCLQAWSVSGESENHTLIESRLNWSLSPSINLNTYLNWSDSFGHEWTEYGLSCNYYF